MPKKPAPQAQEKPLAVSLSGDDRELLERMALTWRLPPPRVVRLALRCFDSFIPLACQNILAEEAAQQRIPDYFLEIWAIKMAQDAGVMLPFDVWQRFVKAGSQDGLSVATLLQGVLDAHFKIKRAPANVGAKRAKEKGYDAPFFDPAWQLNGQLRERYLDALYAQSAGREGEPSVETQIAQAVGQALERVKARLLDAGVDAKIAEGVTTDG